MKSATLVINNQKKFCDKIWQCEGEFTEKQWRSTIKDFADIIQDAYDYLSEEHDEDDEYPDDKLYRVGDVANMLRVIDVKLEEG